MQSTNLVTTNLLPIIPTYLLTWLPTYLPKEGENPSITGIPIDDNVAVVGSVWPKKDRKKIKVVVMVVVKESVHY